MSLGAFFRDYVYIPLGGSRAGTARTIVNTLIVWLLTGLWHGASWNFVLWGLYFGLVLLLERFVLKNALLTAPKLLQYIWTSLLVLISWVIFYEVDMTQLVRHLGALVGLGVTGWIDTTAFSVLRTWTVFPLLAWLLSLPTVPAIRKRLPEKFNEALSLVLTPALLLVSVVFLIGQSYNPFIYFRF
jgi:alginate O-acetyltransferase complex protein AlgI